MKRTVILWMVLLVGCPGYQSKEERLDEAIRHFNTLLKFKEYSKAARDYVIPFYRKEFLDKYEDSKVYLEGFEVYRITPLRGSTDRLEVHLHVLLRKSDSTIVKRVLQIQRWVYYKGRWMLEYIGEKR